MILRNPCIQIRAMLLTFDGRLIGWECFARIQMRLESIPHECKEKYAAYHKQSNDDAMVIVWQIRCARFHLLAHIVITWADLCSK